MRIDSLTLRNFRSFKRRRFDFESNRAAIVGPNASGKSNVLESIFLLATGRSPRAELSREMIHDAETFAVVSGRIRNPSGEAEELTVKMLTAEGSRTSKKFEVNKVGRSFLSFGGHLACVLFTPEDLQLVLGSPETRRDYLNRVCSLTSRSYGRALLVFDKVRRSRNRLLERIREGRAVIGDLEFWDDQILALAPVLTAGRQDYFRFLRENRRQFDFAYHPSPIGQLRLSEFRQREVAAGRSLIGPHRDDFSFGRRAGEVATRDLARYGSRGEQRLATFELKMMEIAYLETKFGSSPVLLLDDIFSELDRAHRQEIVRELSGRQVIFTLTDREMVAPSFLNSAQIISFEAEAV